jgi:two-component system sensor histidine kinase UhpB
MVQPTPRTATGTAVPPGLGTGASEGPGLDPLAGAIDDCERRVRAAVARDLHDRVAQPLSTLLLVLEELKRDPGDRRRVMGGIDSVQDQVRTALFGLREVLCQLREQEWMDAGLVSRIRGELETLVLHHPHLDVRLRVSPRWPAPVRSRVGDHLLQIVREATHNARFHGGAGAIEVVLGVTARRAEVIVSDDGRGLDGRPVRAGMGLLGMHERATLLGGRLRVGERPGGGTRLRVTVPREVLG